jgi:hypothetical protein
MEPKPVYPAVTVYARPSRLLLFVAWLAAALPDSELHALRLQARETLRLMPDAAGLATLRPALELFLQATTPEED